MLSKWSPPILAPYSVALLCMGPCHGQAQTSDSNNRFFPSSSLIPLSSYFQCLMQTVSHFPPFSFFFVRASFSALHFIEFLDPCRIWHSNSLQQNKWRHIHDGLICRERIGGGVGWGCRHSGCCCSGRLSTRSLPEPNMWFNPQGTGWHFLNVSAAFCTCLHSSTRHRGEGAPLVETSKPWHVCLSYARNWHHLTLRKADKK